VNAEARASLWSRLTFSWVNPLITFGLKHYIKSENLPEISDARRNEKNTKIFEEIWLQQKNKSRRRG
jgi:hypothetical protein